MEESELEYITVLDHSDGRVYQYENLEHLTGGWNGVKDLDAENIEWYLEAILEHDLSNCSWMVHSNPKIIRKYEDKNTRRVEQGVDLP